jgi:diguanylate cyclase (GGDEF)-like protein
MLVALAFTLFAISALAQQPAERDSSSPAAPLPSRPPALRTITTLHEAHSLSTEEAARGYPIHVRATVTYYDLHHDPQRIVFFLHDRTGDIFTSVPPATVWLGRQPTPGTLVDVSGVSAPGNYAPVIEHARIVVIGRAHLPRYAERVSLSVLLTGTKDSQWVEIQGIVHSAIESTGSVSLRIAMDGGDITATTVRQAGVDYQSLVDKWATIRGVATPSFNDNRQLTGVRLLFPGMQTVTAVAPGLVDAFVRPPQPINTLLRFDQSSVWTHHVHIHGIVTLSWPGHSICIQDDTGGVCGQTQQTTKTDPGTSVDVIGFTSVGGLKPALLDAGFLPDSGTGRVAAIPITPEQALDGRYDSELVQMDGRLVGRNLGPHGSSALILSSGPSVFLVYLPSEQHDPHFDAIQNGSLLRITGICSVQVDSEATTRGNGFTQIERFSILLQSPASIVVLQRPSWWTTGRIGFALLFTLAVTLAGFVWVIVLRRRVEQQTRELRESRELYRHMAHHDPLTGVATRTLLHDRLQIALDRAQRFRKSIALLMLDLDKFKQINDYFGHGAGDQVLRVTAERILITIRKTDSVARMGGDEFLVLLTDLADPGQAEQIAAKIVVALSEPVRFGKHLIPVSVSVGVCMQVDDTAEAELLIRRVDAAMYRAKAQGRGRFQIFTSDMARSMPTLTDDYASIPVATGSGIDTT